MNFLGLVTFCLFAAFSCSAKQDGKPRQENIRADFYNLDSVEKFERIPDNVKMRLLYDDGGNGSSPSAYYSKRPGKATRTHRCGTVDHRIPSHLTFITRYPFYSKYTHAYGIPIIASSVVSDEALKRACYVTRFLFADRSDIRENMYKYFGRVAVIGKKQKLTEIPEFSNLPDWWNRRARGLGGTLRIPVSCGGEENLLCLRNDRYYGDDIFFHETAHAVAELAIRGGPNYDLDGLYSKLQRHYKNAKRRGLWRNTYAMDTVREYFAEGAQSFFNCHISVDPPNGIHNNINTRDKLLRYDPGLYGLLEEVFPCKNTYHWCYKGAQPDMRMDCNEKGPKPTRKPTKQPVTKDPASKQPPIPSTCEDSHRDCAYWSQQGHCEGGQYQDYMKTNCKKSCQLCKIRPKTEATTMPVTLSTQQPSTEATQIPESKQPPTPSTCEDNDRDCAYWSQQGHCEGGQYQDYMKTNCRKSCQLCKIRPKTEATTMPVTLSTQQPSTEATEIPQSKQPPIPSIGEDNDRDCAYWSQQGHCEGGQYQDYMKTNCRKSCQLCKTRPKTEATTMPVTMSTQQPSTEATEIPQSKQPPIPSTCEDNDRDCAYWSQQGHCEGGQYQDYMKTNCRKSCQLCKTRPKTEATTMPVAMSTQQPSTEATEIPESKQPPIPSTCEDNHKNCAYWSGLGHCKYGEDQAYMRINCKKSCEWCTSGPETGVDRNKNCAAWANDKTCKYNQWMKDNCCISCKLCTPLPTTGPKTVPTTVPTTGPKTVPTTHPTAVPTTRRTTISTQGPTTKGDKDSNCPAWADSGYCSENRWVRENCCRSCGLCTPAPTAGPTARPTEGPTTKGDKNVNCASWAEAGYCVDYNPPWMKANCCKSCGFC